MTTGSHGKNITDNKFTKLNPPVEKPSDIGFIDLQDDHSIGPFAEPMQANQCMDKYVNGDSKLVQVLVICKGMSQCLLS